MFFFLKGFHHSLDVGATTIISAIQVLGQKPGYSMAEKEMLLEVNLFSSREGHGESGKGEWMGSEEDIGTVKKVSAERSMPWQKR